MDRHRHHGGRRPARAPWLRRAAVGRLLLAAFLAVLAAPVGAEPPGPPHPGPPHHRGGPPPPDAFVEWHAERLGLDEETREKIRAIANDARRASEAGRARLDAAHERLRALLDEDEPDEAAVLEQADVIGALESEERRRRLAAMLAIRSLLSDEQRAELVRIREEAHLGMGGPRERRSAHGRPCGPELEKWCPEAPSGRDALLCLAEHWDEVSPRCRSVFEAGSGPDGS
jgi:Spy/CpxP family protein refolding chaperone